MDSVRNTDTILQQKEDSKKTTFHREKLGIDRKPNIQIYHDTC